MTHNANTCILYICIDILIIASFSVYTSSDAIKAQKCYDMYMYIQNKVKLIHSLDGLKSIKHA